MGESGGGKRPPADLRSANGALGPSPRLASLRALGPSRAARCGLAGGNRVGDRATLGVCALWAQVARGVRPPDGPRAAPPRGLVPVLGGSSGRRRGRNEGGAQQSREGSA